MRYWRTFGDPSEDRNEVRTHLEGPGDGYTLCGFDTAGDPAVHRKPPECLPAGRYRITCPDCLEVIEYVREYLER